MSKNVETWLMRNAVYTPNLWALDSCIYSVVYVYFASLSGLRRRKRSSSSSSSGSSSSSSSSSSNSSSCCCCCFHIISTVTQVGNIWASKPIDQ